MSRYRMPTIDSTVVLTAIAVALTIIFIGIAIAIAIAIDTNSRWRQFATEHHCREIGEMSGSATMGVGIGTNGSVSVVPVIEPSKTGYVCDDGRQYWRRLP